MGLLDQVESAANQLSQGVSKVLTDTSTAITSGVTSIKNGINQTINSVSTSINNLTNIDLVPGQILDAAANATANLTDLGNILSSVSVATPKINIRENPPFQNVLHNFASYNYVITLMVVDPIAYNYALYRVPGFQGSIILQSGSGNPNNRVQTEFGKFDFFIDDLTIKSVVSGNPSVGNAEACEASFKIIEPYSMGLFFQSLEIAAADNGYPNYLEAPLVMKIEFKGHLNQDFQGIDASSLGIENTTKYFSFEMSDISMKVSGKGAEYSFTGTAKNLISHATTYSELKTDISISGSTIHEMLQTGEKSLQKVLNDRLKEAAERTNTVPDQVLIYFPKDVSFGPDSAPPISLNTATVNPSAPSSPGSVESALKLSKGENATLVQQQSSMNAIGIASMGFNFDRPADQSAGKESVVYNTETHIHDRSKVLVNPNVGEMRFKQGQLIQDVINEVVVASDYTRQALTPEQITPEGKIPYWKIETQMFYINDTSNIAKTGIMPKMIVYRVVPYFRDASRLLPPNSANPWSEGLVKSALKEYNYIYTGKNLDVLNFNIEFLPGFYKATSADNSMNSESTQLQQQKGNTNPDANSTVENPDTGSTPTQNNLPTAVRSDQISSTAIGKGGTNAYDTPATTAARRMHDILLNSVDMVELSLTILGDPYFLGDSGVGNYVAKESNYSNMNADYAMNTQNGDVHIVVNFRTPIDIDPAAGAYNFGKNQLINRFSGVYTVNEVTSKFSKGKFTQDLVGGRVEGQTSFDGQLVSTSGLPKLIIPTKAQQLADEYGTIVGSEQSNMLAEQEQGF